MKAIQFTQGSTTINKIQFSEIEDYLVEKGMMTKAKQGGRSTNYELKTNE